MCCDPHVSFPAMKVLVDDSCFHADTVATVDREHGLYPFQLVAMYNTTSLDVIFLLAAALSECCCFIEGHHDSGGNDEKNQQLHHCHTIDTTAITTMEKKSFGQDLRMMGGVTLQSNRKNARRRHGGSYKFEPIYLVGQEVVCTHQFALASPIFEFRPCKRLRDLSFSLFSRLCPLRQEMLCSITYSPSCDTLLAFYSAYWYA
jgi:hypothetical protein